MSVLTVSEPADEVKIPLRSVLRYMGCPPGAADPASEALAKKCIEEIRPAYRACYNVMPVVVGEEGVDVGACHAPGRALSKNLAGCGKAIIFAATIGFEPDRQRERAQVSSPAMALAFDAAGTAAVEAYCDLLFARWKEDYAAEGRYIRPRFSPGYGDLPLEFQRPLLGLLDSQRKAGITLTETLMMVPGKSVSAIVGIGEKGCTSKGLQCDQCGQKDCQFRLA